MDVGEHRAFFEGKGEAWAVPDKRRSRGLASNLLISAWQFLRLLQTVWSLHGGGRGNKEEAEEIIWLELLPESMHEAAEQGKGLPAAVALSEDDALTCIEIRSASELSRSDGPRAFLEGGNAADGPVEDSETPE